MKKHLFITRTILAWIMLMLIITGCNTQLYETKELDSSDDSRANEEMSTDSSTSDQDEAIRQPVITIEKTDEKTPINEELPRSQQILELMTVEDKVSQLFVLDLYNMTGKYHTQSISQELVDFLDQYPIGGVIFFSENIDTYDQTSTFISQLQSASKLDMFIAIDEEGGIVSRLGSKDIGINHLDKAADLATTFTSDEVQQSAMELALQLRELGFNYDFAPVYDINSNPNNPVIGSRSFGSDPELVADYANAFSQGLNEGGVISSAKHFPGHGDTETDSHLGMASISGTKEDLYERELIPFISGIDINIPSIMIGHITIPNIDPEYPASLSPILIQGLLRDDLNYQGLVVTDSLRMEAITDFYQPHDIGTRYLQAGGDIILIPNDFTQTYDGILQAISEGRLTEDRLNESVLRILELKLAYGIIK